MYCSQCGKLIKEGQRYCSGCGAPVLTISINRRRAEQPDSNPYRAPGSAAADSLISSHSLPENKPESDRKKEDTLMRAVPLAERHASRSEKTDRVPAEEGYGRSPDVESVEKSSRAAEKTAPETGSSPISEKVIVLGAVAAILILACLMLIPRKPEEMILGEWNSVYSDYPDMEFLENGDCYLEFSSETYRWEILDGYLVLTSNSGYGGSEYAEIEELTLSSLILNAEGTRIQYEKP